MGREAGEISSTRAFNRTNEPRSVDAHAQTDSGGTTIFVAEIHTESHRDVKSQSIVSSPETHTRLKSFKATDCLLISISIPAVLEIDMGA